MSRDRRVKKFAERNGMKYQAAHRVVNSDGPNPTDEPKDEPKGMAERNELVEAIFNLHRRLNQPIFHLMVRAHADPAGLARFSKAYQGRIKAEFEAETALPEPSKWGSYVHTVVALFEQDKITISGVCHCILNELYRCGRIGADDLKEVGVEPDPVSRFLNPRGLTSPEDIKVESPLEFRLHSDARDHLFGLYLANEESRGKLADAFIAQLTKYCRAPIGGDLNFENLHLFLDRTESYAAEPKVAQARELGFKVKAGNARLRHAIEALQSIFPD